MKNDFGRLVFVNKYLKIHFLGQSCKINKIDILEDINSVDYIVQLFKQSSGEPRCEGEVKDILHTTSLQYMREVKG